MKAQYFIAGMAQEFLLDVFSGRSDAGREYLFSLILLRKAFRARGNQMLMYIWGHYSRWAITIMWERELTSLGYLLPFVFKDIVERYAEKCLRFFHARFGRAHCFPHGNPS